MGKNDDEFNVINHYAQVYLGKPKKPTKYDIADELRRKLDGLLDPMRVTIAGKNYNNIDWRYESVPIFSGLTNELLQHYEHWLPDSEVLEMVQRYVEWKIAETQAPRKTPKNFDKMITSALRYIRHASNRDMLNLDSFCYTREDYSFPKKRNNRYLEYLSGLGYSTNDGLKDAIDEFLKKGNISLDKVVKKSNKTYNKEEKRE